MASKFPSNNKNQMTQKILYVACCYFLFLRRCNAEADARSDTLLQGQQFTEGDSLNSASKIFRMEFFSSSSSKNKYLGIFYNPYNGHPVWVANRNDPVVNMLVRLTIDSADGRLKISHPGGNIIVSDSTPVSSSSKTSATLLDNGNLVLRMMDPNGSRNRRTLWQSFDHPTDALLPEMKMGINFRTGHEWLLTSWTSDQVPAPGSFTLGLGGNPNGSSQLVIWWHGQAYWTGCLWERDHFNKTRVLGKDLNFTYISNEKEKLLTYSMSQPIVRLDSQGAIQLLGHNDVGTILDCTAMMNKDPGCVMEVFPKCKEDQALYYYTGRDLVRGSGYKNDQNQNLSLFDCRIWCLQNCSCIAFASANDANGTGCETFHNPPSLQR